MEVIGHRGCGEQYPENTIHAVKQASRYLTTIEVDVRRCKSGELVVFHDERVDRVTDGEGSIAELEWDELRELEVLDSGETIPLLSEMLAAFPSDVKAQIELKATGMASDVMEATKDIENEVYISSFIPEALREVKALDWDVSTGYLFETDIEEGLETAVDLGCDFVHPYYRLCLETDLVDDAHNRGLGVIAWKAARTEDVIELMRAVGADGITADRWDIA